MGANSNRGISDRKFLHYVFDSGENKGQPPTYQAKSELDRSLNIENRGNGLNTRFGCTIQNVDGNQYPSPIAGNPHIMSGYGFSYGVSSEDIIYTAADKIFRSAAAPTVLKSGLTSGLRFQHEQAGDVVYSTNGTDAVQYYDPNRSTAQTYTAGYATPGAFTTTPAPAGGSMGNGTYSYYVTWFDSNTETESNIQTTPVTAVVVGPTGQVTLNGLPIDPESRTSHWIIYRKDPTGNYHYRLDKIVYNAGVPTYVDVLASTGVKYFAPDDNDRPDPSATLVLRDGVMVYAFADVVTWSKRFRYQNVPTYNRERLDDNSTKIVKVISFRRALVVFKTDSIYVFRGDLASGQYTINKISGFTGTRSPRTVVEAPDGIFFLDQTKKPRFINSTDFDSEDLRESTDISHKYRRKFALIGDDELDRCHAVLWESGNVLQYRLWVTVEPLTVDRYASHCYVYDIGLSRSNNGNSSWFDFKYNFPVVSSTTLNKALGGKELYLFDDYGLVRRADVVNRFFDDANFWRAEGQGAVNLVGLNQIEITAWTVGTDECVGEWLFIYEAYTYDVIFFGRITSNTNASVFTLDRNISGLSISTDKGMTIGGYLTYFASANYSHDRSGRNRAFKASVLFDLHYVQSDVQFFTHYDFNLAFNFTYDYINNPANPSRTPFADNYTLAAPAGLALYGSAIYGTSKYAIIEYGTNEFLLNSKHLFNHISFGIVTREPDQPFGYLGSTIYYQPKGLVT